MYILILQIIKNFLIKAHQCFLNVEKYLKILKNTNIF